MVFLSVDLTVLSVFVRSKPDTFIQMCQDGWVTVDDVRIRPSMGRGQVRRSAILEAAIDQFSRRGVAATSMANIAEAAGVSRPALYQYFSDKDEIFASAFVGLFEQLVHRALVALEQPGTTADRLDEFLQRYEGDLFERMSASPHVDEIIGAKNEQVAAAAAEVVSRLAAGLEIFIASVAPGDGAGDRARRSAWIELLRLAPKGLRFDQPNIDVLRERLTALAHVVASAIDGG